MSRQVLLRDEIWDVESEELSDAHTLLRLRSKETGALLTALVPPDVPEPVADLPPALDRRALSPFGLWQLRHELLRLAASSDGLAALHAGRVQLEPYQLVAVARLFRGPRRNLLIADDVGLGKTVEAGLCVTELIARGFGKRVLLVVPPGLIDQWVDEMSRKFGLVFKPIADSASLDQAQTALAEGISPWVFHDRVITSIEYLKRPEIYLAALRRPWDIVVVDEAHYLVESGSPANPYNTRRTLLGPQLRKATRSLILLTATPHNGYRHSFRSLIELIEPTDATLAGDEEIVRQRVGRTMIRRLKQQITRAGPNGGRVPAFIPRAPVERLDVQSSTDAEREIFALVTRYCSKTAKDAAGTQQRDLVSFAMQIVKKRMLSSRLALTRTIEHRLDALKQAPDDEGPNRMDLRELQGDLPIPEEQAERIVARVLRSAVPAEARRRNAEKRQLLAIRRALQSVSDRPDPKVKRLIADLRRTLIGKPNEKAIVFTEYRDTLEAIRNGLLTHADFADAIAELPGGLTNRQRRERIAMFAKPECRVLLATDAASEGLNLQEYCRRLYHMELPWNPNRLEQRNGRIDRYGQRRTPQIAYLFYADSPEDRVLDRLIARIGQMQADRVSTPDIVGILDTGRLSEQLTLIGSDEDGTRTAESFVRVFEDERATFARDLAPLLTAGMPNEESEFDAYSADPIIEDDFEFETVMQRLLTGAAVPTGREHEFKLKVPTPLQGPGVAAEYMALTFRRSIALRDDMDSTEFVHRLHPLGQAAAAQAKEQLTRSAPGVTVAPYLSVRRLRTTMREPWVLFTFLDRAEQARGVILAVGILLDGREVQQVDVQRALSDDERPGDVPWMDAEEALGDQFSAMRTQAERAVLALVARRTVADREGRARIAHELRSEVGAYNRDRMQELDAQEAAERAGTREQTELFRDVQTNWDARRAAVATNADARLREIADWESVPDAPAPDPLGVLVVFPGASE